MKKIAIIGRPNVGKSSLFNRLVKKRDAITSEQAGTTRDVKRKTAVIINKEVQLLDTGGLDKGCELFDKIKEKNILCSARQVCDENTGIQFAHYFIENNSLPRGIKIDFFFKDSPDKAERILREYNKLNSESLVSAEFTPGATEILKKLAKKYDLIALSGGERLEVIRLFRNKNILNYFTEIWGGPSTKWENHFN